MDGDDDITERDRAGPRLRRGVSYIEQNIDERISLPDLAAQAAFSQYHFHRLFRSRYGVPVMDYVRRRRLAQAAERLIRTIDPIVAIALGAGFESQAAFTRAFRRVFLATPAAYRARGRHVPWLSASALSEETLATLPELGKGSPRLQVIDGFEVAGLEALLTGDGRTGIPALWECLARLLGPARFHGVERFGISDASPDPAAGVFRYVAAVALEEGGPLVRDVAIRTVSAGRYLVFPFNGAPERLPAAIDYLYGIWMPCSDYVLRRAPSFERYPIAFVAREKCDLELWLPVK